MKKAVLKQYARLIARTGRKCAEGPERAHRRRAGSAGVHRDTRRRVLPRGGLRGRGRVAPPAAHAARPSATRAPGASAEVKAWEEAKQQWQAENLPARIVVLSEDPGRPRRHKPGQVRLRDAGAGMSSSAPTSTRARTASSGASPPCRASSGPRRSSPTCPKAGPLKSSGRPSSPAPARSRATRRRTGVSTTWSSSPAPRR